MSKTYSNKAANNRPSPNNFLEALRELGQDVAEQTKTNVRQAVTSDIPESFGLSHPSGTISPNESVSLAQLQEAEKAGGAKAESVFNARLQQMREEEHARMVRQESQIREQIKSIQDELRSLTSTASGFAQEIQVATLQATVNPGVYHKNFFAHLKLVTITLRKQVNDSRQWLAEHNGRAKKQGFYWSQVGKSGTKYMLSSERYMVTSTG